MPSSQFSYERLRVHAQMLEFITASEGIVSAWDPIHSVVDQFERASESALLNLAEASRSHRLGNKIASLEYSLGSILECASCMDVAEAKSMIDRNDTLLLKRALTSIFRQLIGLRNSWQESQKSGIRETEASYGDAFVFRHEQLAVYQLAIKVVRKLSAIQIVERLSRRAFRRIDEPATSIVLNIAEGNGRFAHLDHQRFLEIANRATTKLACRLDIGALRGELKPDERDEIKAVLAQVDAATAALAKNWGDRQFD